MSARPTLLLEINEVPWRVLDRAVDSARFPNLARFLDRAWTRTTISHDVGELSPWVTWPSLHRGLDNTQHGVLHLGQDVATFRGVPLWEEYRRRGESIGVLGSLQSWPPIDPGPGGFFVPDTFAADERCVPATVEPLQRLNLAQVRANGRTVRATLPPIALAADAARAALALGLPARLALRVVRQLVAERIDPTKTARRPVFQTILFWEVFKRLFDPSSPPALSTFFTNHVASAMHRYWDDFFPEDFGRNAAGPHGHVMWFALTVLEDIVRDALAMQRARPDLVLVLASSMGQAAVHRSDHHGREIVVERVDDLMAVVGLPRERYRPLLAMVPQVAVAIDEAGARTAAKAALERIESASGQRMFAVDEIGSSLSITARTPCAADVDAAVGRDGERAIPFRALGIEVHRTDPGTAYHVPEGSLAIAAAGIPPDASRAAMPATDVKRHIMELAGLHAPLRSTSSERSTA